MSGEDTGTVRIAIGGEKIDVTGVTWMDHEYGVFENKGQFPKWFLQDIQLDSGVCISCYATGAPQVNQRVRCQATGQLPGEDSVFVEARA